MSKRKLPEGEQLEALVKEYPLASEGRVQQLSDTFGFANVESFQRAMRHQGAGRITTIPDTPLQPEVQYIPYPQLKLKPFKIAKVNRDEEDLAIVLADLHIDKITENYNIGIVRNRMDKLLDSSMTIINLHRPIRKVHVFGLGDMVQGENPYQGSKIGEVEGSVAEQIHDHAIPLLSRFLESLAQGVRSVEFYGVRGNHGRYSREAPDKTNWDLFLYKALAYALINQKTVAIHPTTTFYQLVNIRGFRFFTVHGDQVHATAGIPLFAMRRKMQEWYAYVGGFNYAYAGHFHSGAYDQVNSHADYTICPPLVTGDSWALEKVGRASEPKQLCFGIHDKYGRTFEYKLHTDDNFLPKKFDEPEGVVTV